MNETFRYVVLILVLVLLVAAVLPGGYFVLRMMDTWTTADTGQLLGGGIGICGGAFAVLAVVIGMGVFARLAGWKPPRRDELPPTISVSTPQQLPGPDMPPPWGMTGGGSYQLMPSSGVSDSTYQFEIEKPEKPT